MSNDGRRVGRERARHWVSVSFGLAALAILFLPAPAGYAAPTDRHFRIEAGSFAYAPAEIAVNPGDRVMIELASTDVVHGLYLDGYDLDVMADPGRPASLAFVADQPGAFRFRCSVTCGALHPFMIGKLTVGGNDLLWRAIGLAILAAFAGVWLVRK
jgi:heme/copper-type cytochrome/quinol oxidase subunit 2